MTPNAAAAHDMDPFAGLPEKAREKFENLTDRLDDARTLARDSSVNDLIQAKMQAAQRVAELTDPATAQRNGYGTIYGKGHAATDDAEARLAKATKELKRAQERAEARQLLSQQLGQLHTACDRWISQESGKQIAAFEGMAPKTRRTETHLKAIARIRAERVKLEADLQATKSAPITSAEAKETIRQEVEALAQSGKPDCTALLKRGAGGIAWPKRSDRIDVEAITPSLAQNGDGFKDVYNQGVAFHEAPDGLALVAWLFRDTMLERLEGEIDSISDDAKALTIKQRAERDASIRAAILDSERAEEFYCGSIEAEGGTIERRADLDPRAFLGVQGPRLLDW